jgi:hypothetical protein
MKQITKYNELNEFAALLLSEGYEIIYPNKLSSYFHFFKNGGMGYVQYEQMGGVSFSSEHKPCKEAGTGYSTGRHLECQYLTLENAKKACSNIIWPEHEGKIKFWLSVEQFINHPMNKGRYQTIKP